MDKNSSACKCAGGCCGTVCHCGSAPNWRSRAGLFSPLLGHIPCFVMLICMLLGVSSRFFPAWLSLTFFCLGTLWLVRCWYVTRRSDTTNKLILTGVTCAMLFFGVYHREHIFAIFYHGSHATMGPHCNMPNM